MNHRTAVRALLALALMPLLAIPAFNLSDAPTREYAWRLVLEKKHARLQSLLYNADFLLTALGTTTWRAGWSMDSDKVVVGQDSWLYLGDRYANNLSAHRTGELAADAALATRISTNLLAWERWLHAHGVRGLALVIGPDKHRVYQTHLPHWANLGRPPKINGLVHGVASRLIADPGPELQRRSSANQAPTYYKSDTHWNLWGAAIGMAELRRTLERQGIHLNWAMPDPPAIDHISTRNGGDLAGFLRIQGNLVEQDPLPVLPGGDQRQSDIRDMATDEALQAGGYGQLQFPGQTVRVVTTGAANALKVLWLRDSFGIAQSPMMAAHFQETIQIHWGRGLGDGAQELVSLVRKHRPDLLVLTVVERAVLSDLLLTPPPSD